MLVLNLPESILYEFGNYPGQERALCLQARVGIHFDKAQLKV